jgi:hypothetical protein
VFHLIQTKEDEEASEPTSPTASLEVLDRLRERARTAATEVCSILEPRRQNGWLLNWGSR